MRFGRLIWTIAALFFLGSGQFAWSAETVRVGVARMITPVSAVRYYLHLVTLQRPTA